MSRLADMIMQKLAKSLRLKDQNKGDSHMYKYRYEKVKPKPLNLFYYMEQEERRRFIACCRSVKCERECLKYSGNVLEHGNARYFKRLIQELMISLI